MSQLLDYLVENEPSFRKARLPALYSDFQTQKSLNPDGYQANISAWRRALSKITQSGLCPSPRGAKPNLLVLNCDEQLLRALESKQYGRPLALGAVVRESLAQRDLVPLQDFLQAKESIYLRPSWSVWNLASWTMRQLGVADILRSSDKLPAGQFVVVANVEEAGKTFADKHHATESSRFERTFSKAHFYKTFNDQIVAGRQLSDTDMDVLLRFMARDKGVILYDGQTVKIKSPGGGVENETAITEEDASIAQLKELLASLTHQTSLLSNKVEELNHTAKEAVTRKNRVAALAALKSKKIAESTLEKRFATVNQLEEVAAKIEQASDNIQLVKVMESSGEVLASLHKQVGGTERVEEVVDRLREQMGAADEVNSILAEVGGAVVVDEAEIDDELAALEGEERRKVEEVERRKVEEQRAREAEETRKRLEAAGAVPGGVVVPEKDNETREAEDMMSALSLEENEKQKEPALAA